MNKINDSIDQLKAVLEPNRLKVLCMLSRTDICVCKLAKQINISHNLLSFHLKTLSEAGILDKNRQGNEIFYFIRPEWKNRVRYFFKFLGLD